MLKKAPAFGIISSRVGQPYRIRPTRTLPTDRNASAIYVGPVPAPRLKPNVKQKPTKPSDRRNIWRPTLLRLISLTATY